MATTFHLTNTSAQISRGRNDNNATGSATAWKALYLSPFAGASNVTIVHSTIRGPTTGQTIGSGSVRYEWLSAPISESVILQAPVTFSMRAFEAASTTNATIGCELTLIDYTGSIKTLLTSSRYGTELATSNNAVRTWTATPAATTASKGDRIRATIYVDDANSVTLSGSSTVSFVYNNNTGQTGESRIIFRDDFGLSPVPGYGGDYYRTKRLTSSGAYQYNILGYGTSDKSIACSADGTTLVSTLFDVAVDGQGSASVFTGTRWETETILTSSVIGIDFYGTIKNAFGDTIACSTDTTTIVVGGYTYFYLDDYYAVAYSASVEVCTGPNWSTRTILTASDNPSASYNTYYGRSGLACSSDAKVIVVGDDNPSWISPRKGQVYAYSGTNWATETIITGSLTVQNAQFGTSIACSDDGTTIVVGASSDSGSATMEPDRGRVYIYTGSNWNTEYILTGSNLPQSARFGYSVACSADGKTVVVGAFGVSSSQGQVYVYSGTNWTTRRILSASDRANSDYFGYIVKCSKDGSLIMVGAPGAEDDTLRTDSGKLYLYTGSNWTTEIMIVPDDNLQNSFFPTSIALPESNTRFFTGLTDTNPGAIGVFEKTNTMYFTSTTSGVGTNGKSASSTRGTG